MQESNAALKTTVNATFAIEGFVRRRRTNKKASRPNHQLDALGNLVDCQSLHNSWNADPIEAKMAARRKLRIRTVKSCDGLGHPLAFSIWRGSNWRRSPMREIGWLG